MDQAKQAVGPAVTRRDIVKAAAACAGTAVVGSLPSVLFSPRAFAFQRSSPQVKVFDVLKYGATGDGKTLDSVAFQRAIDEASAYSGKAQVLVRGGHKYLVGTLELKGSIDFHLADDAELLISTNRQDYRGGLAGSADAATMASAAGGGHYGQPRAGPEDLRAPALCRGAPRSS